MNGKTIVLAVVVVVIASAIIVSCGESATLPVKAGMGPSPELPPPNPTLIPTVKIAKAVGWPTGITPVPAAGTRVNAFATGLDHPRWLLALPNGDVLVAESNAPAKPEDGKGIKGFLTKKAMERAGAGVPSADRITLLRDTDGDGIAEFRSIFIEDLKSPFGMALLGDQLFVANTDGVVSFPYEAGTTEIRTAPTAIVDLPAGPINHHWTKSLIASPDGSALFATVGSNSNVGENDMQAEVGRAALWKIDPVSRSKTLYATGLRNPNGLAFEPTTGMLWTTVNERDEIGSDLVPDYMTSVREGGFYGWPYSYFGQHVDVRVKPPRPDLVEAALVPDYALGPHTASLGLVYSSSTALPDQFRNGMFIGQHGSWNRNPPSGYRVIFVPFAHGKPNGEALDILTGFLSEENTAYGRPVGVEIGGDGALLVADDVGNAIWRVVAD
ncbi:sorbosone dehydrogenase family protein [Dokdonella sp.]|uniref:PQQ-dependent sugar dehydrogenase n=1 Tax=Dokdonella sp. TaxID=2291710 RepID=UPI00352896D0